MALQENYGYDEVLNPDLLFSGKDNSRRRGLRDYLLIVVVGILASMTTFLAMRTTNQTPEPIPRTEMSCGNSSAEATSLGCTFDALTFAWLPPSCPRDMTDEFLDYAGVNPWEYWVDKEGEVPIRDYETISKVDWYWTTNAEHLSHCSFMLLRFHKAMERGERADGLTMAFGHAEHCLMFLLDIAKTSPHWNTIGTHGNVGFENC